MWSMTPRLRAAALLAGSVPTRQHPHLLQQFPAPGQRCHHLWRPPGSSSARNPVRGPRRRVVTGPALLSRPGRVLFYWPTDAWRGSARSDMQVSPSADRAQRRPPLVPESGTTGGRSWALLRLLIPGLLQVDAASCAQAPARQSRFSRQTVTAFRARQAGEPDWEEKEVFQWPGGNTQCHWHCGSTPGPVTVAPAIMSLQ